MWLINRCRGGVWALLTMPMHTVHPFAPSSTVLVPLKRSQVRMHAAQWHLAALTKWHAPRQLLRKHACNAPHTQCIYRYLPHAQEATADARAAVAASYAIPHMRSSPVPQSVLRGSTYNVPHHTMNDLRVQITMETCVECAMRPTRAPRAWEATAASRPVPAALRPPPRVVSSPVPRYIAESSACHVPMPPVTASLYTTMEACMECATRRTAG